MEDLDYNELKSNFIELLSSRSFSYNQKSNSKETGLYIDYEQTLLSGRGLYLLGNMLYHHISYLNLQAIGGLKTTFPMLVSTSMFWSMKKKSSYNSLTTFYIKKKFDDDDINLGLVGPIFGGERVILLHDVISTGEALTLLLDRCESLELKIEKLLIMIDKDEKNLVDRLKSEKKFTIETLIKFSEITASQKLKQGISMM